MSTEWLPLIHRHVDAFVSNEQQEWDKVRSWLQGRYWTQETGGSETDLLKCSLNYVFAITETACSSLVPRSPSWTVTVHEDGYDELAGRMEEYLRVVARINEVPQELVMSISDVVLYGRSVLKTTWDKKRNIPKVRRCDPRSVHFDLSAQRTGDVGYWIEVSAVSRDEFERRVNRGKDQDTMASGYKLTGEMPQGGDFPDALRDRSNKTDIYEPLRNWQKWVTVYEVYSVTDRCTYHYYDGQSEPLFTEHSEDEDYYCPYTLYSLNNNSQDLRGLSEILLIAPNVDDINRVLSYWLNIVRRQIPRIGVDGSMVGEDGINRLNQAPVGAYVLLKKDGETGVPIEQAFFSPPIPNMPSDILSYMGKLESNVSFVSALAEAARGQVTGAKTATEMALIEAQLRTRLQARQAQVDRAINDIGKKMIFLSKQYLKSFKVPGPNGYTDISAADIARVDTEVEIVPYNPVETNRAVYEERFMKLLSFMTSRPSFDQRAIDEEFTKLFRLNPEVLTPDPAEQAASGGAPSQAELAAAAQQVGATPDEVAMATGGQAVPVSQLPPQAAAVSDAAVQGMRPVAGGQG